MNSNLSPASSPIAGRDTAPVHALAKVPEVTLVFWLIKIAATTLGETGGDAVSMSMNLGYLVGTGIFAAIFLVAVIAQVKAKGFHPALYWTTIIATTTPVGHPKLLHLWPVKLPQAGRSDYAYLAAVAMREAASFKR